MRTNTDRIRHSLLYEAILLALLIPLGSATLEQSPTTIGALCIAGSLVAVSWNYVFNIAFDKTLQGLNRPLYPRGLFLRTTHAVLFEATLLLISIPVLMWWLKLTLIQALSVELGFIILVPLYTLAYNWLYDLTFPVKGCSPQTN